MAEQPYKRTSPKKRVQELQQIESDLAQRLPQDVEDPEVRAKRIRNRGIPDVRGATVIGKKKKPNTA